MGYAKIRPRRGTLAEWTSVNPVLAEGEFVLECPDSGVGTGLHKIKVGDGFTAYDDLPYAFDGATANAIYGGSVDDYCTICIRSGTTAEWEAEDPILESGEIAYDTTTNSFKVGNGSSKWSALEYITASYADSAGSATEATHATSADSATTATTANYATSAGTATTATTATTALSINVQEGGGTINIKTYTYSELVSENPVLEDGEIVYCSDTYTIYIGDGSTKWSDLKGIAYQAESASGTVTSHTASEWASLDPVLEEGEIGYDSTNGGIKIGDGSSKWSALEFVKADSLIDVDTAIYNFLSNGNFDFGDEG